MYEIFEELLKKSGARAYDVAKAIGVSPSLFSDWKKGRYTPKQDKLQALARYFGVPISYLLTGEIELPEGSPEYLYDDDARDAAEFLHKNPEYKVLFDATRKIKPSDIEFVRTWLDRIKDE